ncbi:kxDL motif-containing protein CG10681 isoform X4 [Lepeophtheirus salmonis]|uniref:kxDL motif-containing protein CG10681 isoform X4 n=1 Tax=Lepeophtheirus salmonis TaxID=72036 RepID=UPI003AF3FF11
MKFNMSEDSIEESKGLECSIYQNYTASEVFIQGLAGIVNQQDIASIVIAQKKMLQRFEKTNEMLANCNSLSMTRYEKSLKDFKNHTKLVTDMRKDLDSIFKRIKVIKSKMVIRYPEAVKGDYTSKYIISLHLVDIQLLCPHPICSENNNKYY